MNSNLSDKSITKGKDVGKYYIFKNNDLKIFRQSINISNLTSNQLIQIVNKFISAKRKIFYKNIQLYNPLKNRMSKRRVLLIDKVFLDNYKKT